MIGTTVGSGMRTRRRAEQMNHRARGGYALETERCLRPYLAAAPSASDHFTDG